MRSLVLSLLVAVPALPAQQATYTFLSQPASYVNYTWLDPQGPPRLGTIWEIAMPCDQIQFNAFNHYYLLTGASRVYVDLGVAGLGSGVLFSSAELVSPAPCRTTGRTLITGRVFLLIPNDPALIGFAFYQQVLRISRTGGGIVPSAARADLSRGGHGALGT